MRARRLSDERGIALAVAVFALVVIGVLVAGTFFAGRLEQQTGRNAIYAAQAAEVAEAGLNEAVNSQTAAALLAMPVTDADPANATALTTYSSPSGYASATRSINRLTDNLFLVRSLGARTNAGGGQLATRSLGQLIRLVQLDIEVKAGLTALGDVTITGGAEVSGYDQVPPLWGGIDCPPLDSVTGVRYNNGTLTQKGNGSYEGDPASEVDASLNPTDMKKAFDQLKAMATLILANSNPAATVPAYTATVPQRCNTAVETNWGEPEVNTDPCFNYFPVIYHNGNLKLQGDRGQGILLVEGDLTVTGSMVFYGPVFVTGTLSTSGTGGDGAKFYGGVIAGNVALDDLTKLAGGAMVNYSSCALKRALDNTATPAPLAERSWVQLYSLQ
jgi:Tfp pilus assembly protein PilX